MDQYGGLFRRPAVKLAAVEERIEKVMSGPMTPKRRGRLAKLFAIRDQLLAHAAAKKGAALAAAAIPGVAGGLASSGIRGMDVIEHEFSPEVIRQHNLEGAAQGFRQMAVAPPGSGRLDAIPFVVVSLINPVQTVVGGAAAIGATTSLVTKSVNWAVLKIVGLTTQTIAAATGVVGVMQDFKIGGSPNLFLDESWVLMDDYDTDKEQYAGLRAYPTLIAPNTASVDIAAFAPAAQTLFCAVSLVVDVLRDDAFGPGLPGTYAR